MPWQTPTLRETRRLTRDYVLSQLGAKAMIPNSVLRIMSDAMAGLAHLTMLYIDWLAKQLMPDTAEQEWLDRHGNIWLVNADGSTGRKAATYAKGIIEFTGDISAVAPIGTLLSSDNGIEYQTVTVAEIAESGLGSAGVVALTPGTIGNLQDGEALSTVIEVTGITGAAADGDITGGVEQETDDQLRERVLARIRQPPMGGSQYDYVNWTLAVPGVTRAWCNPLEMGIGTATVRFMMDDLRESNGGFPTGADVEAVKTYLSTVRPVAVKDIFVVAPLPQRVDVFIMDLKPDDTSLRAAVEQSLKDMLFRSAAPGQTIFAAWKYHAIMDTTGIKSLHLTDNADDVMESPGHMAVLGDIVYGVSA